MSVGIRSTSQSFPWPALIAGNGKCSRCRRRKIPRQRKSWNRLASTLLKQGKRKYPLPLHPIPSPGCKKRKKCQACAQSKMSDMSPAVHHLGKAQPAPAERKLPHTNYFEEESTARKPSARLHRRKSLASGAVIRNILFQGFQFTAEVVDSPLQQIANGKNPQQLAVIVGYRQVAEVAFQHGGQRFAGPGPPGSHLDWRRHQFTDRRRLRVGAAEGHLPQDVALGKNSGNSIFRI